MDSVAIATPLMSLIQLSLVRGRLRSLADEGRFLEPAELGLLVSIMDDALPAPAAVEQLIKTHMGEHYYG